MSNDKAEFFIEAFYFALPYIVCLIVLIFTSKKKIGPKALGNPFEG